MIEHHPNQAQQAPGDDLATTPRCTHATPQDRAEATRKLGEQTARVVSARAVSR